MEPHELVRKTQHTPNPAAQDPDADPFLSIHSENREKEMNRRENEFCRDDKALKSLQILTLCGETCTISTTITDGTTDGTRAVASIVLQ